MPEFHLSILTPEGPAYEGAVDYVSAPGWEGPFGVLARHTPMVVALKPGPIRLRRGEETLRFKVEEGVVEIHANRMMILSPRVVPLAEVGQALAR